LIFKAFFVVLILQHLGFISQIMLNIFTLDRVCDNKF